jgi:hypothetical protein
MPRGLEYYESKAIRPRIALMILLTEFLLIPEISAIF